MLLVFDTTVEAWIGVQMGVWGWGLALVDRQTGSLNLHEPCVCSGTGFFFSLAKSLVQDRTGEPAREGDLSPCAHSVWWERQACLLFWGALKNTFVPCLNRALPVRQ